MRNVSSPSKHQYVPGVPSDNILDLRKQAPIEPAIVEKAEKRGWPRRKKDESAPLKSASFFQEPASARMQEEIADMPSEETLRYVPSPTIDNLLKEKTEEHRRDDERAFDPIVEQNLPQSVPPQQEKSIHIRGTFLIPVYRFALAAVLVILPIAGLGFYYDAMGTKTRVLGASEQAVSALEEGGQAAVELNAQAAQQQFASAAAGFLEAEQEMRRFEYLTTFIPMKEAKSGSALVATGKHLATAAELLTASMAPLAEDQEPRVLYGVLQDFDKNLETVQQELDYASEEVMKVDLDAVPEAYRQRVDLMQTAVPQLSDYVDRFASMNAILLGMLGFDHDKRYLVIFQNSAELRPTGGFIGSFALMRVHDGVMEELEVPGGGSYDVSGQSLARVVPPAPLLLANDKWQFQDANYFPDFQKSAEKIRWFYQQSGGPSTDGVMALDPYVLSKLLEIIGPVDMTEEYGVTVDKDNVVDVLMEDIESKKDTTEPKKIIADLAPKLLEQIFSSPDIDHVALLSALDQLLSEKHLLLSFDDETLQENVEALGWGGRQLQPSGDYLMIVDTNITGGKTDLVMEELADLRVRIEEDGTVTNTLTVTRTHKGDPSNPFSGVMNKDFMRIYVPKGSTFVSAGGFDSLDPRLFYYPQEGLEEDADWASYYQEGFVNAETGMQIGQEGEYTVFGNWVLTEAGQSSQVSVTYTLPWKIAAEGFLNKTAPYSLLLQKQPGTSTRVVTVSVALPDNMEAVWSTPQKETNALASPLTWTQNLSKDAFLGVVLKKQ